MSKERIEAAALRIDGEVLTEPPPARHHNLIHARLAATGVRRMCKSDEQGFVTSEGRYVSRAAAAALAYAAGQIPAPKHRLYSEDLW